MTDTPAPADLAALTGLEQMRAIAAGATEWRGIGHLMGFRAVEVEGGRVVFAGAPGPESYNPHRHGPRWLCGHPA